MTTTASRRTFLLVVPYTASGRARELRVDVVAGHLLEAMASAWRVAEAMCPLLGGPIDAGGPFLLIAPLEA